MPVFCGDVTPGFIKMTGTKKDPYSEWLKQITENPIYCECGGKMVPKYPLIATAILCCEKCGKED